MDHPDKPGDDELGDSAQVAVPACKSRATKCAAAVFTNNIKLL
jgi:hypothetical protein